MKTLFEILKDYSRQKIVDCLRLKWDPKLWRINPDMENCTVKELSEATNRTWRGFIDKLLQKTPNPNADGMVFIAHPWSTSPEEQVEVSLFKIAELSDPQPDRYSYLTESREDVLGYFVAETDFAKENMPDFLSCILWEMTFFGMDDETYASGTEEIQKELESSIAQLESAKPISEVYKKLGYEPPKRDEIAEELKRQVTKAQYNLNLYYMRRELDALRELLALEEAEGEDHHE